MVRDLKNRFDFFLRNNLRWGRAIPPHEPVHPQAEILQEEMQEFLSLFSWTKPLERLKGTHIVIGDVGTRTFAVAETFEKFFKPYAEKVQIHGFEIDAYRRFTNFRTRADYGLYYAKRIQDGHYHPIDFAKWTGDLDIVFMLHPFVSKEPLLAWGLPLKEFKPETLFECAAKSVKKRKGLMLLSSPNEDEYKKALELSLKQGFKLLEERVWSSGVLQKQPRLGALFTMDTVVSGVRGLDAGPHLEMEETY